MNILITGMTAAQTGSGFKKYMTVIYPIMEMLSDYSDNVEMRQIYVNEDLSKYDKIICGLFPVEKLSATKKYAIFDAIARYPEKIALIFDDWQYYQFQDSLRVCINSGRFWNFVDVVTFANKHDIKTIKDKPEIRDRIYNAAYEMLDDLKYPLLFPKLWWGRDEFIKVKTTNKIYTFDIMSYALEVLAPRWYPKLKHGIFKKRQWVLASLFDNKEYVDSLKLTWPVYHCGHKNNTAFMPENLLVNFYKENFGIISHPYKKLKNDGWWRARWMHACYCGNIILANDQEAEGLPLSFFFSKEDIEKANDQELHEIAKEQRKAILSGSPDCFDSAEILNNVINSF